MGVIVVYLLRDPKGIVLVITPTPIVDVQTTFSAYVVSLGVRVS